ncbi:MAG TPA: tetratricopeptide repeat protein [Bryobacteraceae bacterium]|nr:tetratricopeptide repeat protein [Bryobacteraceae bacterium]
MSGLSFFRFGMPILLLISVAARCSSLDQTLAIQQEIESGNLAAAFASVQAALRAHPTDGGLFNLRGVIHAKRSEIAKARADFQASVTASPHLVAAWKNLARACEMRAPAIKPDNRCAINAWQRVSAMDPADTVATHRLARLYTERGEYGLSLAQLKRLSTSDQSSIENMVIRGEDLAGLRRSTDAQKLAAEVVSHADFSEKDLDLLGTPKTKESAQFSIMLLRALDSHNALTIRGVKQLAIAYEEAGDWKSARQTLERAAAIEPTSPSHLLELARVAEIMKDHEGALGYLAHARDLSPKNPQVYYLMARVASEMDLAAEARQWLSRALAIDPDNPHYNYAMGYVTLATREASGAVAYFKKYVKANPQNPSGHYALGIAYFTAGEYPDAKRELRIAERSDKAAGADYFLGRIARIEGDMNGAIALLRKSMELSPDFAPAHTELARVWIAQNKLSDAERELAKAIQLDSDNFMANEQLLAVYRRTKDPRATQQSELLKKLDEERSKRAELMLRSVEFKP